MRSEQSLSPPPKKIIFAQKEIDTAVLIDLGDTEPALAREVPALHGGESVKVLQQETAKEMHTLGESTLSDPDIELAEGGSVLAGNEPILAEGEPSIDQGETSLTVGMPASPDQVHSALRLTREPDLRVAEDSAPELQEEGPGPMEGYEQEEKRQDKEEILKLKQLIQTFRIQQALKWREMEEEKFKNHVMFEKYKKKIQS